MLNICKTTHLKLNWQKTSFSKLVQWLVEAASRKIVGPEVIEREEPIKVSVLKRPQQVPVQDRRPCEEQ